MWKNGLHGTTALLLAGLLASCGGADPSLQERDQPLDVAPVWMAELDLPGCDCASGARAGSLLVHPFDDQLVIAVIDGAADCVAARPTPTPRDSSSVKPGPGGGINPVATVMPGDDPVPIKPDERREGRSDENNNEGTENGDDPPTPGDTIKLNLGGDDPVPIRDNKVLPVLLDYSE